MNMGELLRDALKYPFSDWKKIFLLGILILVSSVFITGLTILLIPNLIIAGVLIYLFVLGYLFRIIKSSIAGEDKLPDFNEWTEMFSDGFKVFITFIIYLIPSILIILISGILFSSSQVADAVSGGIFGGSFGDVVSSLLFPAGPFFLIALLYLIVIVPFILFALINMAENDVKISSALKFGVILDKISIKGWKNVIGWYLITGALALVIVELGFVLNNILSIINPLIGLVFISLIFIPYVYIYISRSLAMFYIDSEFRIPLKYVGVIVILVLAVLFIGLTAFNSQNIVNPNNIHAYNATTNTYSANGISFNYPSNWDIQSQNDAGNTIVQAIINDTNFEVSIAPPPAGLSGQNAFNVENPSGWQQISNNSSTVDGTTAYETIYRVNNTSLFQSIMIDEQIMFNKNGNSYMMDFLTPEKDYNHEKPNFDEIVNSFKTQ